MLRILLEDSEPLHVDALQGVRLTDVLRHAGHALNTRCGERGTCRGCEVDLLEGRLRDAAGEVLETGAEESLRVRGCQTFLESADAVIQVPRRSLVEAAMQIAEDFATHEPIFDPAVREVVLDLPAGNRGSAIERLVEGLAAQGITAPVEWDVPVLNHIAEALAATPSGAHTLVYHLAKDVLYPIRLLPAANSRRRRVLGLAVDIGTTTVVTLLVDLRTGAILGRASQQNAQARRADDVATRIGHSEEKGGLEELRQLIVEQTIIPLARRLCEEHDVREKDIVTLALSGNTVMELLLLGIPVGSIGRLPFEPAAREFPLLRAGALGLPGCPRATVRLLPCAAGYVGGDIVSDLYACSILKHDGVSILLDIGTNGEMVLAAEGELLACATAAGPAFEGGRLRHGSRASPGAIEHVTIARGGRVHYTVIGGGRPTGVCGSAIVDFIAEARTAGLLNQMGRLDVDRLRELHLYADAGKPGKPVHALALASPEIDGVVEDILITERDIAEIMKAKAAIYAGMRTLLEVSGKQWEEVDRVILAGGFARHLRIESAIGLGLLPELDPERFHVAGNGSLAGAYLTLVEREAWPTCGLLARMPRVLELNTIPGFEDAYIDALAIPHLDEEEFPRHFSRSTPA